MAWDLPCCAPSHRKPGGVGPRGLRFRADFAGALPLRFRLSRASRRGNRDVRSGATSPERARGDTSRCARVGAFGRDASFLSHEVHPARRRFVGRFGLSVSAQSRPGFGRCCHGCSGAHRVLLRHDWKLRSHRFVWAPAHFLVRYPDRSSRLVLRPRVRASPCRARLSHRPRGASPIAEAPFLFWSRFATRARCRCASGGRASVMVRGQFTRRAFSLPNAPAARFGGVASVGTGAPRGRDAVAAAACHVQSLGFALYSFPAGTTSLLERQRRHGAALGSPL